jgi:hypothetical protein
MAERARWGLVAIVAVFCILGAAHSVIVPLFEAPDEIWHFSFVRILATQRALPVQPTEGKDVWLREAGQPPLYYLVAASFIAPLDSSDFPGFVRFNAAHPAVTPGLHSDATNIFIHTLHEKFPYRGGVLAVHVVRLLSVLWGAGTVVGAYLVAREVAPGRPGLALATAAITAFNPHFIFISSVVNNDVCAACVCTFGLWLAVRLKRETGVFPKRSDKTPVSLGIVLGLALLTKMSALALVPLVALALGLVWWRERDGRALLVRGTVVFGLAGVVGVWWYVRNWALYGDPLAWGVWMMDLPVVPIGLIEVVRQLGHVATSYWAPYDGLFPPIVFWGLGLLAAAAVLGWIRLIVRRERRAEMNAAALSLLVALGLDALAPRRWSNVTMGIVEVGLLALSIVSPFCAIRPRFASPLIASAEDISGEIPFDDAVFDAVRLLGAQVEPDAVAPGAKVDVTLYWEALSAPPDNLRAVVQLWTLGGRLVGQRDTAPAGAVYPPDLWRAGDIVRDAYRMQMNEAGLAMCRVVVRVLVGDEVLGEVSSPAMLRLTGEPVSVDEIAYPLAYTLGDQVELIGYDMPDGAPPSGEPLTITLYWRALAEMNENYTVFVHLLDRDGMPQAQGDGPPLNNDYPTSYWMAGDVLADVHTIPLEDGLPTGARLRVGLYRLADGVRLPVYTAQGERVPDDAIALNVDVW